VTRASGREYAAAPGTRYQQATRAENHRRVDAIVAVTGLPRKAALRLLRRAPRPRPSPGPGGRPREYGPEIAAAAAVRWPACGRIGAHRLPPFVPELLERLTQWGELALPPAVDKRLRQASRPTLARLLAPTRAQYPRRGRRPPGPAPSSSTRSPSGPSRSGKMPAPASSRSIWSRLVAPPPKASTSVPSARSTSPPPGSSWTPSAVHALYEVQWCGAELRRCRPAGFRGQYSLRGRVVPLLS